jgi:hypothetical protein
MKTSPFMCSMVLSWGFFLLLDSSSPFSSKKLHLVGAQEDANEGDGEYHADEDDMDEEEGEGYDDAYDPLNENELNPCRRNPTWWRAGGEQVAGAGNNVDYENCQGLAGWSPRDSWWHVDTQPMKEWLSDGKEQKIAECLDAAFVSISIPTEVDTFWWAA